MVKHSAERKDARRNATKRDSAEGTSKEADSADTNTAQRNGTDHTTALRENTETVTSSASVEIHAPASKKRRAARHSTEKEDVRCSDCDSGKQDSIQDPRIVPIRFSKRTRRQYMAVVDEYAGVFNSFVTSGRSGGDDAVVSKVEAGIAKLMSLCAVSHRAITRPDPDSATVPDDNPKLAFLTALFTLLKKRDMTVVVVVSPGPALTRFEKWLRERRLSYRQLGADKWYGPGIRCGLRSPVKVLLASADLECWDVDAADVSLIIALDAYDQARDSVQQLQQACTQSQRDVPLLELLVPHSVEFYARALDPTRAPLDRVKRLHWLLRHGRSIDQVGKVERETSKMAQNPEAIACWLDAAMPARPGRVGPAPHEALHGWPMSPVLQHPRLMMDELRWATFCKTVSPAAGGKRARVSCGVTVGVLFSWCLMLCCFEAQRPMNNVTYMHIAVFRSHVRMSQCYETTAIPSSLSIQCKEPFRRRTPLQEYLLIILR